MLESGLHVEHHPLVTLHHEVPEKRSQKRILGTITTATRLFQVARHHEPEPVHRHGKTVHEIVDLRIENEVSSHAAGLCAGPFFKQGFFFDQRLDASVSLRIVAQGLGEIAVRIGVDCKHTPALPCKLTSHERGDRRFADTAFAGNRNFQENL